VHKILTYSSSKCTGCRYCEVACTFRHFGVCGRSPSRIRIVTDGRNLTNKALFCHHCKKPVCINVCPVDAFFRDEKTGLIRVDSEKCTGCGTCVTECPLGGIKIDKGNGQALNCDLCNGEPACVEFCPKWALQYIVPGETPGTRASDSLSAEKKVKGGD
jgi:Fe-S-cluster-containing hydrogenase component 2